MAPRANSERNGSRRSSVMNARSARYARTVVNDDADHHAGEFEIRAFVQARLLGIRLLALDARVITGTPATFDTPIFPLRLDRSRGEVGRVGAQPQTAVALRKSRS